MTASLGPDRVERLRKKLYEKAKRSPLPVPTSSAPDALLQGPPGVGKSHLAVALGVRAVESGFSVAFFRLEELLAALKRDGDLPPHRLRRRKYNNVALVIIDEVGFEPMDRHEASLFFRLVSYRYRRGSTARTTNKSIKDWPGILAGDEALATAILDRLLHKSVVLNLRGRSYRVQDLEKVFHAEAKGAAGR